MKLSDFDYLLPSELIAQKPLARRDGCRLMKLDRASSSVSHHRFYDLSSLLRTGDVLVFNDSKVLPARVLFQLHGRECEIFYLKDVAGGWEVLVRPGKYFQEGDVFSIDGKLECTVVAVHDNGSRILHFSSELATPALLEVLGGITPLPPYIHEKSPLADYQTIYAHTPGSVAAPTAGLHFTEELFATLDAKGIQREYATLHVGAGTFLPVQTENIEDHAMHSEWFELSPETCERLNAAKKEGRRIIAVGTTACRILETATDMNGQLQPFSGTTNIFIYPGYEWKMIDALITNFHFPKSTLLMLVSSLAGRDFILRAYEEAVAERYRFYSFGDAMFIE